MSINRRRWSNEFLDSLMNFQSRGSSQIMESTDCKQSEKLSNVTGENCTNITSVLEKLNLSDSSRNLEDSRDSRTFTRIVQDSDNRHKEIILENDSLKVITNNDYFNKSLTEENDSSHSNTTSDQFVHICDLNQKLSEDNNLSSGSDTVKLSSSSSSCDSSIERQSIINDNAQNLIELDKESIPLNNFTSIDINIKNNSNSNIIELTPSYNNECSTKEILINNCKEYSVELSTENVTHNQQHLNKIISDNIEKLSSIASLEPIENISMHRLIETSKEGHNTQRFFSSPLEFSENNADLIIEMDKPDVWDALLELDRALSPFEDCTQDSLDKLTDAPNILTRLSQKFKQTPTRFTEKLVSIIEDSVISLESPTKQSTGNNSEISLNRITGEFRKLCKFVEDESMPELAPSLTNITSLMLDKTETPENKEKAAISMIETPKNTVEVINKITPQNFISKAFKCFATPKSRVRSNSSTPMNQFTPTADKSFEYWEKLCNVMCETQSNINKNKRKSLYLRESSKLNMNEMLSICERQLASLNDSNIDIRSSDPCKKSNNEMQRTVITPRSKSVSKISQSASKIKPSSLTKSMDKYVNNKFIHNNAYESHKSTNTDAIAKEIFVDDISPIKRTGDFYINTQDILEKHSECINNEHLDIRKEKPLEDNSKILNNQDLEINEDESCDNSLQKDFNVLLYSPNDNEERSKASMYDTNEQDCSLLIELAKRRQRCLDTAKLMLEIDREDPIANEDNKCLETLYKLGSQNETFTDVEEDTKFLNTLNHCLDYQSYFKDKSKPIINMFQKLNSPDKLKYKTSSLIRSQKLLSQPKHTNLNTKIAQNSSTKKLSSKSQSSTKCLQNKTLAINKLTSKIKPKISEKLQIDNTPLQLKVEQCKKSSQEALKPQVKTPRSGQTPAQTIPKTTPNKIPKTTVKTTPKNTPKTTPKNTPKTTPKNTPKTSLEPNPLLKQSQTTPKPDPTLFSPKLTRTPEKPADEGSQTQRTSVATKPKLFLTPGKDRNLVSMGRKKPTTYFSLDGPKKPTPQKISYDSVKSPISLYIKSTDTDLVQNIHGKINDHFLTPVKNSPSGKSPQLKFKLSSKENASPVNFNGNIVLPQVNYQSAKKVRLIEDTTEYSPNLIPPRSKTKKLLEPIENTVVIRHEGRIAEDSIQNYLNSDVSFRVQKVAAKASPIRNKIL